MFLLSQYLDTIRLDGNEAMQRTCQPIATIECEIIRTLKMQDGGAQQQ